jgi:alpha-galactosidase
VTIIGAGSVEFTRNILTDLCSYEELHGDLTIPLHDIDAERLAYTEGAARQVVERLGAGYPVAAFGERRGAFEGSDYLINEIQVGGYAATVTDFEIPRKYGVLQTIADTIGIGGIMRGLRTIPVMVQMGTELAELCPDGLLLNYTNSMAMVPWGIWAGSAWPAARTIGVCHSVRDTHAFLGRTVGVPLQGVEFRTAGFNHQCFVYVFGDRETGQDLTRACARLSTPIPRAWGGACGSRSSSASATSRPRAPSTRSSTSRGSSTIPTRSSGSAARSTRTSGAAMRTSKRGRT